MANRERQLEDSEELRKAIEELQAKVDAGSEEASDNAIDYSEEVYSEDAQQEYYDESGVIYDESGDYVDYSIDEGYNDDRAYDEPEEEEKPVRAVRQKNVTAKRKKKKSKSSNNEDVIISVENVTKEYVKDVPALNDVSFTINRGEFVFIVGDSGSGKSTLIKLLLRELKPTSGSIMVNGFQVDKLRNGKIPKLRRNMGVVFQDFRLLKDRDVYENVAFAQRIIQRPSREIKKNVPKMLAAVGLAGKYRAKIKELSGGEQQRVALARALVNRPPILLADEPTGNLDPKNTLEIMSLLEKINQDGTTVIVVTHNDKIVNDMQKRVITIKNGIVISDEEKGGYIDED